MKKIFSKFRKRLHSGAMDDRQQRAMFAAMAARRRLGPASEPGARTLAKKQIKQQKLDVKRYKRGWAAGQIRTRIESLLNLYTTAKRGRTQRNVARKSVHTKGYA